MLPFLFALFVIIPLYHLYIGFRLLGDLPIGAAGIAVGVACLVASSLLIPLAMLSRRMAQPLAGRLAWAGFIAMGLFSTVLVLTLLRDVALLAMAAATITLRLPELDNALLHFQAWSATAIPIAAVVASAAGYFNARRRATVKRVEVPIAGLPAELAGFTIAQITDVHVGATIRRGYLEAIVDATNALQADLIAVTGDMVDGTVDQIGADVAPLAKLAARHGVFFVTGNHEYYSGVHSWMDEMRRLGLRVLINEHVVLDHAGAALVIAGVTDFTAHHFDPTHRSNPTTAIAGAPHDAALRVLLAHQPRSSAAAAQAGFDLQLSGHTHGGQFLPWPWFVRIQQPFTAGLHRVDDLLVYVSRGAGYWGPPKRIGAPSEITLLQLIAA